MLNKASKGKDLAEKQLIVLGGTAEQQREFLEQLNPENLRTRYGPDRRKGNVVPVSNRYALGYTYHDVLDADQEDTLARINIYLLANPSAALAPLLKPLLTTKTVKDTLITILLDWSEPFKWARQLRQWIRLLRSVILSLDEAVKIEMEENMTAWKEKRVGPDAPSSQPGGASAEQKPVPVVTIGPGEWDEGLGVPLSVVCVQAEKMETFERDFGWQEDQFDFLMQWLRCVLLKHGASLVYTASFDPNHVRTLIHSSLSIQSLLKREVAKHNVVQRDRILVPPDWDSWGKIRVLKDGFDLEGLSRAWSVEIQAPPEQELDLTSQVEREGDHTGGEADGPESAVDLYESALRNPLEGRPSFNTCTTDDGVTVPSVQEFLQSQYSVLESLKADDDKADKRSSRRDPTSGSTSSSRGGPTAATGAVDGGDEADKGGRMAEHIGPYQINVNGIDFDAEEATRRLREREKERSGLGTPTRRTVPPSVSSTSSSITGAGIGTGTGPVGGGSGSPGEVNEPHLPGSSKHSNEAAAQFFANLIKKDRRGMSSLGASPTRATGSPLTDRRPDGH